MPKFDLVFYLYFVVGQFAQNIKFYVKAFQKYVKNYCSKVVTIIIVLQLINKPYYLLLFYVNSIYQFVFEMLNKWLYI